MSGDENLAKGFTCECGKDHTFPVYVYAHWNIQLTHTCDACGAEHVIVRGHATLERKGRDAMK